MAFKSVLKNRCKSMFVCYVLNSSLNQTITNIYINTYIYINKYIGIYLAVKYRKTHTIIFEDINAAVDARTIFPIIIPYFSLASF